MSAVASIDVFPTVLPWRQIFDDMKERGFAYTKQARGIGVAWSTYQRWFEEEAEPRHSDGVALLELHTSICGAELTRQRLREGRSAI